MSNVIAYILNNLFLVAAGGLVAAWLAWRMWKKVEGIMNSTPSWSALAFWTARMIVIVGVLFFVGKWIYSTVNAAVVAAVNSPSTQTAAQALVDLGGAVDSLMTTDFGGSFDMGGNSSASMINLLEPTTTIETEATTIDGNSSTQTTELNFTPLSEMFKTATQAAQSAAVNASINAPANAPTAEYIVQPGDSVNKIAKRLGIDAKALCKANGLSDCSLIRVGQKLVMPGAVAKELTETITAETSAKIATPRQAAVTVYTQPKRNQSYLPSSWNVLEQGEMSVGDPATIVTNASNEPLASFTVIK